jgi:hypothetical protein
MIILTDTASLGQVADSQSLPSRNNRNFEFGGMAEAKQLKIKIGVVKRY